MAKMKANKSGTSLDNPINGPRDPDNQEQEASHIHTQYEPEEA